MGAAVGLAEGRYSARGFLGWGTLGAASFMATHGKEAIGDRVDGWMVLGDGSRERA